MFAYSEVILRKIFIKALQYYMIISYISQKNDERE